MTPYFLIRTLLLRPLFVWALLVTPQDLEAGGWIEDAPGKTIIHVEVYTLPDPSN